MLYRIVALIESAYYIWYSKEKDTEITAETNYSMKVQTHHTHKKKRTCVHTQKYLDV